MSTLPAALPACSGSQTCHCLSLSLQEETAASRRYLAAAGAFDRAGLQVVSHAFRFTAAQEKEHAAVLRGLLESLGTVPALPPEDLPGLPADPASLLEAALSEEESARQCAAHARIAAGEGFPRIAAALSRIAENERLHARRFRQYASALQDGTLLRSHDCTGWLCLPCGQRHFGYEPPAACDACGSLRGHFIRSNFHPFAVCE